jgi:quinol monooxygenase YgiN
MYGTVARMRVKPGMFDKLRELMSGGDIPGHVDTLVYQMDSDPNQLMMAVIFDSKEAYVKNADSPEMNALYEQYVQLLEGPPEWNDGEIVHRWNG